MLSDKQIKARIFAAAVDGIRKTAFYDGLHVEMVEPDKDKTVTVFRCSVAGQQPTYVKITVSNMVG